MNPYPPRERGRERERTVILCQMGWGKEGGGRTDRWTTQRERTVTLGDVGEGGPPYPARVRRGQLY